MLLNSHTLEKYAVRSALSVGKVRAVSLRGRALSRTAAAVGIGWWGKGSQSLTHTDLSWRRTHTREARSHTPRGSAKPASDPEPGRHARRWDCTHTRCCDSAFLERQREPAAFTHGETKQTCVIIITTITIIIRSFYRTYSLISIFKHFKNVHFW